MTAVISRASRRSDRSRPPSRAPSSVSVSALSHAPEVDVGQLLHGVLVLLSCWYARCWYARSAAVSGRPRCARYGLGRRSLMSKGPCPLTARCGIGRLCGERRADGASVASAFMRKKRGLRQAAAHNAAPCVPAPSEAPPRAPAPATAGASPRPPFAPCARTSPATRTAQAFRAPAGRAGKRQPCGLLGRRPKATRSGAAKP